MNTRHIQSFLTVSAAFFAMSGPAHAQGANALAIARAPMRQVAPYRDAAAQPAARLCARRMNAH